MTKIKNVNRNRRRNPKDRMQVDNRNIFQLEEAQKRRRDQILKKKRKEKQKQKDTA